MTKRNHTSLYARRAELLRLEEEADQRFEFLEEQRFAGTAEELPAGYQEAKAERDALFDERKRLEEKLLRLRSCSLQEFRTNLSIAINEAEIFDAGVDMLRLVQRQLEAFLNRTCPA